jgi:hypothetical protein
MHKAEIANLKSNIEKLELKLVEQNNTLVQKIEQFQKEQNNALVQKIEQLERELKEKKL